MVSLVVAVHPDCKMVYAEPSLVEATTSVTTAPLLFGVEKFCHLCLALGM